MLALTKSAFEGTMNKLWICALAAILAALAPPAQAFEVQGATVVLPDATSQFGEAGLNAKPGGTLNLLKDDPDMPGLPQYGNSIAIPGPNMDAPAWTYSSRFLNR